MHARLTIEPLPDMHPTLGILAAALQNETAQWRKELAEVDQDTIQWQPFANGHSIGALILHIADVEAYWITSVAAGKQRPRGEAKRLLSEATQQYGVDWPIPPREPLSWYFEQHDLIRARTIEQLKDLDPSREIALGKTAMTTPAWCLAHVLGHENYHGGQAVLVKLMKQKIDKA